MRAFVLGAGLGTRLRPLTEDRPKPLVPLFDRPLITLAFAHLAAAGARHFVVNTHHLPAAWSQTFRAREGRAEWHGLPIDFRYEPVLLDTGGGIKNCEDLLGGEDFWVHNADVVADLDLNALRYEHVEQQNLVTLALRTAGGPLHVGFDPRSARVVDIRGSLRIPNALPCLYTGIAVASPHIFQWIPKGQPVSLIPILLEMIRAGERVGGKVLDGGLWMDLGSIDSYLHAHRRLLQPPALSYAEPEWPQAIAPSAEIGLHVELAGWNIIGEGCRVGNGAKLENCLLWPGAEVRQGVCLKDCIVRNFAAVSATSSIL